MYCDLCVRADVSLPLMCMLFNASEALLQKIYRHFSLKYIGINTMLMSEKIKQWKDIGCMHPFPLSV